MYNKCPKGNVNVQSFATSLTTPTISVLIFMQGHSPAVRNMGQDFIRQSRDF